MFVLNIILRNEKGSTNSYLQWRKISLLFLKFFDKSLKILNLARNNIYLLLKIRSKLNETLTFNYLGNLI